MEPAEECVTTHLPKCAAPKMDGAQVSEAVTRPTVRRRCGSRAEHRCVERTWVSPRRPGATPPGASPGADLGCSSEYSIGCRVAINTPLCVVEDWSGAGFRIKQPLNAGQPIVRQVVNHQTTKATTRVPRAHGPGRSGQQASVCNILLRWAWSAAHPLHGGDAPLWTGKQASGQCTPRGVLVSS